MNLKKTYVNFCFFISMLVVDKKKSEIVIKMEILIRKS